VPALDARARPGHEAVLDVLEAVALGVEEVTLPGAVGLEVPGGDVVGGDSLIIWELPPVEEEPDKWTINVKSNADYIENWSVRGKIRWTEDGSLEILKDDGHRVRLSGYIREFEVDDENQVITARYKN